MKNRLLVFFALTFLFTWSIEVPVALHQYHLLPSKIPVWLQNLGTWAPGIVAITLAVFYGGTVGLKALLIPLVQFKRPFKWYLFSLFCGSAVSLVSFFSYKMFSHEIITLDPPYNLFIIILIVVPFSPLWEEIGWRGFALPMLLNKYTPIAASIILGFLWGLWHLPMYLALSNYGDMRIIFFLIVFGGCFPLSVLQTWIYINTRRSLLLCILFHAGVDASVGYFFQNLPNNELLPFGIVTALLFCLAVAVTIATKGKLLYSKL